MVVRGPSELMRSSLVSWVHTFRPEQSIDYFALHCGVFLNDVMSEIEPDADISGVLRGKLDDVSSRTKNLANLLNNLVKFYGDKLHQVIVSELPDVVSMATDPESEDCVVGLEKLLVLLIGCAVQCDHKEEYINDIKDLEVDVQHNIVEHIRELTDCSSVVMPITEDDSHVVIKNLVEERNRYAERFTAVCFDRLIVSVPTISSTESQLGVELAETKAKIRRLHLELDDKFEIINEQKDEIEGLTTGVGKLRHENATLLQEAKLKRVLQDELDSLRESQSKVRKYENDLGKMRDKMQEMDFLRKRVTELKEDNNQLYDIKRLLEEQVESYSVRLRGLEDEASELVKQSRVVEELREQQEADQLRIQELVSVNVSLQEQLIRGGGGAVSSDASPASLTDGVSPLHRKSFSDELTAASMKDIIRMESDNKRLVQDLENMKEVHCKNSLEIEKLINTNKELRDKVKVISREKLELLEKIKQLESSVAVLNEHNAKLSQGNNELKAEDSLKITLLETQNKHLQESVVVNREKQDSLKEEVEAVGREKRELVVRCEGLVREVGELRSSLEQLGAVKQRVEDELIRSQTENHQLVDRCEKLDKQIEKLNRLNKLESENQQLRIALETAKNNVKSVERLEEQNGDLEKENVRIQESLDRYMVRVDELVEGKERVEVENGELRERVGELQGRLGRVEGAEGEKEVLEIKSVELERENQHVSKENDRLKVAVGEREEKLEEMSSRVGELQRKVFGLENQLFEVKENRKDVESLQKKKSQIEEELSLSRKSLLAVKQDLLNEKIRSEELKTEVSRLRRYSWATEPPDVGAERDAENAELASRIARQDIETSSLRNENDNLSGKLRTKSMKLEQLERDLWGMKEGVDELTREHGIVVANHNALQELHAGLTVEYEAMQLRSGSRPTGSAEYQELFRGHEKLQREYGSLERRLLTSRSEQRLLAAEIGGLQRRLGQQQQRGQEFEVAANKAEYKSQTLLQLNGMLEEENRRLLVQLNKLHARNQELVAQLLASSSTHREEEKLWQQEAFHMQRTKEKLEEKIISSYKSMENSPIKFGKDKPTGLGLNIVRKAKGVFNKPKSPSVESRESDSRTEEDELRPNRLARSSSYDAVGNWRVNARKPSLPVAVVDGRREAPPSDGRGEAPPIPPKLGRPLRRSWSPEPSTGSVTPVNSLPTTIAGSLSLPSRSGGRRSPDELSVSTMSSDFRCPSLRDESLPINIVTGIGKNSPRRRLSYKKKDKPTESPANSSLVTDPVSGVPLLNISTSSNRSSSSSSHSGSFRRTVGYLQRKLRSDSLPPGEQRVPAATVSPAARSNSVVHRSDQPNSSYLYPDSNRTRSNSFNPELSSPGSNSYSPGSISYTKPNSEQPPLPPLPFRQPQSPIAKQEEDDDDDIEYVEDDDGKLVAKKNTWYEYGCV